MAVSKELKKLKKMYGENFMKLCRSLFPTLLEQEGRLYEILSLSFSDNCKTLYEDIVKAGSEEEFKSYIYSKVDVENPEKKIIVEKTPYELLKEAGYNLTECLTEEEIQKFKKYYKQSELLCTFGGGRLDRCVVFWAVKENAEDIKREKFEHPKREDEYGTSVMGIQFNKQGMCTVSIKNRYNHAVNNPDATYGNDLDRIIPGLTKSFGALLQKEYGLELDNSNIERFKLPGYVVANDGKYYKYNMEINGDYYCPGNIVIKQGGEVTSVGNPEECLLIDYFYIDKKKKKIEVYADTKDSFVDNLQRIEKIEVFKFEDENANRAIKIYLQNAEEPAIIAIDKNNQIVKYINKNVINIGRNFLKHNKGITTLEMPNLTQVGSNFLLDNIVLTKLEMPNLIQAGYNFLCYNKGLTKLEMPNLTEVGSNFLCSNERLTKLNMPNLTEVGDCFLCSNEGLIKLNMPKLAQVGEDFLYSNEGLIKLEMPNLVEVGNCFLCSNEGLTKLEMPNLIQAGGGFLYSNEELIKLEMPNLTEVGSNFLCSNEGLTKLEMPNLIKAGNCFLEQNKGLTKLNLPNLIQVGGYFLSCNEGLTQLEVPNLTKAGSYFLNQNKALTRLEMPKLPKLKEHFSKIIDRNISQKSEDKIITVRSIAQLDKESKLTTSELNYACNIIEKMEKREKGDGSLFHNHGKRDIFII